MNSAASPPTPEQAGPGLSEAGREKPCARLRLDLYDNADFDRGASRLKEALWILCKCVFFLHPFPWASSIRVRLLRLFGARIGAGVVIRSGVNITFPWRFTAGDHVWIGEEVYILSLAPVTLGSHVCLSQRAFLCTGSHAWRRETFNLQTRAIEVENSVWISAQAFIGPGTRIGTNSVIGAGAMIMKTVPNNCLAAGNPAVVRLKD